MMRALSFVLLLGCGDGRDDPMTDAGPPCPAEPQLGDEACDAEGQRCLYVRCPDDAAYESRCEAGSSGSDAIATAIEENRPFLIEELLADALERVPNASDATAKVAGEDVGLSIERV
jgi:hypothetical protein